MRWQSQRVAATAVVIGVMLGLGSCAGADLGECDTNLLGGSMDDLNPVPHRGQERIDQSCAQGMCHSAAAEGEARGGVPAGLNFDLVPLDRSDAELTKVSHGTAKVDELAEEMWALIEDGSMPPEGKRDALTADQKETVRNWLACGAPVINKPRAVSMNGNWTEIFADLDAAGCDDCHRAPTAMTLMSGAWFGADACQTRTNLLAGAGGERCGGMGPLVVRMSPDTSILVSKLEAAVPRCGGIMPPTRTGATPSTLAPAIRTWIANGAQAPDCL